MFCCRCFRAWHMGLESQCVIPLVKLTYETSRLPVTCALHKELSRILTLFQSCNKRLVFTVFRDFWIIFDKLSSLLYKVALVQDELSLRSTRFAIQGKKQDISVVLLSYIRWSCESNNFIQEASKPKMCICWLPFPYFIELIK